MDNSLNTIVAITQVLASIATVATLLYTIKQVRLIVEWNRYNANSSYMSLAANNALEERLHAEAEAHGVNLWERVPHNKPLEAAELKTILASRKLNTALKNYLNQYEGLASSINMKAIKDGDAYDIFSSQVLRVFTVYKPYILHYRDIDGDLAYWNEIQKVCKRWQPKREYENECLVARLKMHKDKQEKEEKEFQRKQIEEGGIKPGEYE